MTELERSRIIHREDVGISYADLLKWGNHRYNNNLRPSDKRQLSVKLLRMVREFCYEDNNEVIKLLNSILDAKDIYCTELLDVGNKEIFTTDKGKIILKIISKKMVDHLDKYKEHHEHWNIGRCLIELQRAGLHSIKDQLGTYSNPLIYPLDSIKDYYETAITYATTHDSLHTLERNKDFVDRICQLDMKLGYKLMRKSPDYAHVFELLDSSLDLDEFVESVKNKGYHKRYSRHFLWSLLQNEDTNKLLDLNELIKKDVKRYHENVKKAKQDNLEALKVKELESFTSTIDEFLATSISAKQFCINNKLSYGEFKNILRLFKKYKPEYKEKIEKNSQISRTSYYHSILGLIEKLGTGEISYKEHSKNKRKDIPVYNKMQDILTNLKNSSKVVNEEIKFALLAKKLRQKLTDNILNNKLSAEEYIRLFTSKRCLIVKKDSQEINSALRELKVLRSIISNEPSTIDPTKSEIVKKMLKIHEEKHKLKRMSLINNFYTEVNSYSKPANLHLYKDSSVKTTLSTGESYEINYNDLLLAKRELAKEGSIICQKTINERAVNNVLNKIETSVSDNNKNFIKSSDN